MGYSSFALGQDLSDYDYRAKKYTKASDLLGLDFIVGKIGGSENNPLATYPAGNPYVETESFNQWCQFAYDLDIPFFTYWFVGPRVWSDLQMTDRNVLTCEDSKHPVLVPLLNALRAGNKWKAFNGIFLDYEKESYWSDPRYPINDYWMRLTMEDLRNRLAGKMGRGEMPKVPIGVYSRRSFMDEHDTSPESVQKWLMGHPDMPIWAANWPRNIPAGTSIADVRKYWLPLDNWFAASFAWNADREKTWHLWQFDDNPDYNLFNGTPAEMRAWCGYVSHGAITPPPPPPPPPQTGDLWGTVQSDITGAAIAIGFRSGPNSTYPYVTVDGKVKTGFTSKISASAIDSVGRTWYKWGVEGWSCAGENGKTYIKTERK